MKLFAIFTFLLVLFLVHESIAKPCCIIGKIIRGIFGDERAHEQPKPSVIVIPPQGQVQQPLQSYNPVQPYNPVQQYNPVQPYLGQTYSGMQPYGNQLYSG